jgi:hypothetical protein
MHAMQALSELSYGPTASNRSALRHKYLKLKQKISVVPTWLNFNLEIKYPARRKTGGVISKPRAVGSLRMRLQLKTRPAAARDQRHMSVHPLALQLFAKSSPCPDLGPQRYTAETDSHHVQRHSPETWRRQRGAPSLNGRPP